ncbi:MAG: histidine--tRNA ligase [Acidimicrobiia bacterium]
MNERIRPRTLKGFRDFLPAMMMPREQVVATAKKVFHSFGFSPIDTPALEYSEILIGKGGDESDKQMYRFEDKGGRDVALRFDLTVPLARFVAQHAGELGMPFKRYHVGPVWRGENTQRGRYREFLQCDFDTIGTESLAADAEIGLVTADLMTALGFERFTIRLNNRRVLTGLLERIGLADRTVPVLRALDKLGKIGAEGGRAELKEVASATDGQVDEIVGLSSLGDAVSEVLDALRATVAGSETGERGLTELEVVTSSMLGSGVAEGNVRLDVSTARGLDYYTGTVYETYLDDLPDIGSVCSGGRYDDLASVYSKQRMPGVGASLGVDRLLAAMEELDLVESTATTAPVLVVLFGMERQGDHIALAHRLRHEGIDVELYPEPRKIGAQLKYAARRGHRLAVIVGDAEWEAGTAQVKDLVTGESMEVPLDGLGAACRGLLGS